MYSILLTTIQLTYWCNKEPNSGNLKKGNTTLFYSGTTNGRYVKGIGVS